MLTGALLILAPLFFGFALPLQNRRLMTVIHYTVEALVYFILALLGLGLGQMEGLTQQLGDMAIQVAALVGVLLVANLAGLWLFHRWQPMSVALEESAPRPGYQRLFLAGLKPLAAVAFGVLAGYFLLPDLPLAEDLATWSLMLLLFLIGLQLRNAGLSLRKLLMNRQGLGIALAMAGSSLLAGLALTPLLALPWHDALALASGFGWYSLSGIVVGDAPRAGLGRGGLSQRCDPRNHRTGHHSAADCPPPGDGHRLWRRHRHGFHTPGYPQQRRAGLRAGRHCLGLRTVVPVSGFNGGFPVFSLDFTVRRAIWTKGGLVPIYYVIQH